MWIVYCVIGFCFDVLGVVGCMVGGWCCCLFVYCVRCWLFWLV